MDRWQASGSDNADCAHPPSANTQTVNGYRASCLAGTAMLPHRHIHSPLLPTTPGPALPYPTYPITASPPSLRRCSALLCLLRRCELPPSARSLSSCRDTHLHSAALRRAAPSHDAVALSFALPASRLPLCARCQFHSLLPRPTPTTQSVPCRLRPSELF
jgi:hypothetical protein